MDDLHFQSSMRVCICAFLRAGHTSTAVAKL